MKKIWVFVAVLAVLGVGAWQVAARVESPQQVAARAEPPPPAPVLATLSEGYLYGPLSISATASLEQTSTVVPPSSVTGVVTGGGVAIGEALNPGGVLLKINGRPLFVLPGPFALYRDIYPGDTGDDVVAVQQGLKAAGLSTGRDKSGTYGSGTQAAARSLYRAARYDPPAGAEATSPSVTGATSAPTEPVPSGTAARGEVAPGVPILRQEIMMLPGVPAIVQTVAPVGTQLVADTTLVTLGGGATVLRASVPTQSLGGLVVGATATFTDDSGSAASASVAALTPSADGTETTIAMAPTGAVSPGATYVLAVANPGGETTESLLAPVAGIVSQGGRSYISVHEGEEFRRIEVTVLSSLGGVAAIVPANTGDRIDAGTEIRIG